MWSRQLTDEHTRLFNRLFRALQALPRLDGKRFVCSVQFGRLVQKSEAALATGQIEATMHAVVTHAIVDMKIYNRMILSGREYLIFSGVSAIGSMN